MLKVEVLVFPLSRSLSLDSPFPLSVCILTILSYSLFPSAISISHCNIDQIFKYQNKFCYISNSWLWSILLWKWYGWQDMESRSWWVLVGLICKSVSSCLYLSLKLAPKKFISSFDYSAVNLIMRWKPLSVSLHCLKISIFSMFLNKIYIINIPLPYALL